MRLGLCCQFNTIPIKFRNTTLTHIISLSRKDAITKLDRLCLENANALFEAIGYCAANDIGAFRVNSQILPIKSHPVAGYKIRDLPRAAEIIARFEECGTLAASNGIRLGFHPDQFVVLNSPSEKVVDQSIRELEYHAEVAEWIGADSINIHMGGAYDNKPEAIARFEKTFKQLNANIRERLTIENDDKIYSPCELLPTCRALGIPLVYDVHHHRCHRDELSIKDATQLAVDTWNREPLFHISSPKEGWSGEKPHRHADMIDPADFPNIWKNLDLTVEVEAKAKEIAVLRLMNDIYARPTAE